MATTVTESVVVRRPVEKVAPVVVSPEVMLPLMGGLGRFELIAQLPDRSQEWDLFLDIGTIHVGGRVVVDPPGERILTWRSVRGTRHDVRVEITEHDRGSLVTMHLSVEFAGTLTGPLTQWLARGIVRRHLEAGLQQLRHHLEFEI